MEITYDDFVWACPSSAMPDDAVFNSIRAQIDFSTEKIKSILTPAVFDMLDDTDENGCDVLRSHVVVWICASAFYDAIPQLDLVLTPTGFGVVSNENTAPASADRVQKLRDILHRTALIRLDSIIDELRKIDAWDGTEAQAQLFSSLFWHSSQLRLFGLSEPTRDDLDAKLGEIHNAELVVAEIISPEQLDELRKLERRYQAATPVQAMAIDFCRRYIASMVCSLPSISLHRRNLLRFVEEHIDEFKPYRDSQTYKLNHFELYQNKQDDSCFFFG